MPQRERQQTVLELLRDLRGLDPLKELFWSELNYERVNQPFSRRDWTETAAKAWEEDPVLFAGGGENNEFHVIYARLTSNQLLLGQERPVVSRLLRDHHLCSFCLLQYGARPVKGSRQKMPSLCSENTVANQSSSGGNAARRPGILRPR